MVDGVGETAEVRDVVGDEREHGDAVPQPLDDVSRAPGGLEGTRGVHQLRRLKRLADGCGMNQGANIAGAAEGDIDPHLVEEAHLGGLLLEPPHGFVIRLGPDGQGELAPGAEGGLGREQRQHLVELEHA